MQVITAHALHQILGGNGAAASCFATGDWRTSWPNLSKPQQYLTATPQPKGVPVDQLPESMFYAWAAHPINRDEAPRIKNFVASRY